MKKQKKNKIMRLLAISGLVVSSIFFGVVANITSKYDGSYFSEMFNGSVMSFVITFSPILFMSSCLYYLVYAQNKK